MVEHRRGRQVAGRRDLRDGHGLEAALQEHRGGGVDQSSATGELMFARVAHSLIVRGGQIVRMQQIVDSATVRAAMP